MSAVWSRPDEIGSSVASLAFKHWLVCYDPTTDAVRLPPALGGFAKPLVSPPDVPVDGAMGMDARRSGETSALRADALMDEAICSLGFHKREKRVYTREIGPETLGIVSWYEQKVTGGTKVVIGIRNRAIEAMLCELREEKLHEYSPSSLDGNIHALMGQTQRSWEYEERWEDSERVNQIVTDIRTYALPFMESHVTPGALLEAGTRPYVFLTEPAYRKPLAFYLSGETAKAKQALEQGLSTITSRGAPEYRQFAARLLERMGDTDRAAEILKSVPGLGLPLDAKGRVAIRHRDTGEVLQYLETDRPEKLNLQGADLRHADLSGAVLYRTNLRRARLNGACLDRAQLSETDLRDADLSDASLRGADLRGAKLAIVGLMKVDLRDADLREARIVDSDLDGADLTGAKLEGIYLGKEQVYPTWYNKKTRWPAGFDPKAHGASRG
jgi:hypothetical protein